MICQDCHKEYTSSMEEKYSSEISADFSIEIKRKKERFVVRSFLHIGLPQSLYTEGFRCLFFVVVYALLNVSPSGVPSILMGLVFITLPANSFLDKSLSTYRWMARFTGRAPNSGL